MRSMGVISSLAVVLMMTACQNSNQRYASSEVVSQTYIHKYGVEVPPEDWQERGQDGQVVINRKDGVIVTQSYDRGILHGETTYSYPHSSAVEKTEVYVQGNKTKEIAHFRSGPPMHETHFKSDDVKHITSWYENGTPKSVEEYDSKGLLVKGEYYNNSHQLESQVENANGIRTVRNKYGLVVSKDTIQDGQMTVRTTVHFNGAPKEITPYKNGVVEGIRKTFLPDGEPNSQEMWADGRQQGITILFTNGEKSAEIPYENGQKNGIERHFRDGQYVVEEISWLNGLQDGPRTTYVADIASTEWYFEGQPVSKVNYDLRSHATNRPHIQLFPNQ